MLFALSPSSAVSSSSVTAPEARLVLLAFKPGRRGPMPRGIAEDGLSRRFAAWTVEHKQSIPPDRLPFLFDRATTAMYLLPCAAGR